MTGRSLAVGLCAALCCVGVACAAGRADTLVVAQSLDDIVSLDPAEGFELSSVQSFTSLYQRLEQPDPEQPAQLRPTLASAWEAGADGHSIVFTLRAGAAFASGNPVRPQDVVYSLARAVKLNKSPAFILNELGWTAANVDQMLAQVGERRVRLRWTVPVGESFVRNVLSAPVASIVDAVEVEGHARDGDFGNAWLRGHSAGSGPFRIRLYQPHEALVLDANPSSPGDAPLLKTVVLRNVPDAASRRLLLEVGDVDIARDLGPDQIEVLRAKPGVRVLAPPSAALHYLMFDVAFPDNPVLRNPGLWEAARWLIDYDGIARHLLKGQYLVHQAFLPQGFPGALTSTPYHLDIPKARAILASAGLGEGATIKLDVFNQPPFPEIAQALQASFAQAGIRLQIQPQVAGEIYAKTRNHQVEAVWLYWIQDYFDANSTAAAFASNPEDGTKTVAWRAGWRIPQLTEQTRAARQEKDERARERRYRALQEEVQRASPYVFALQERAQIAMRAEVQGYRHGLNADMVYYDRVTKQGAR